MSSEKGSSLSPQAKRIIKENIEDIEKGDFNKLFLKPSLANNPSLLKEICEVLLEVSDDFVSFLHTSILSNRGKSMNHFKFHPIGQGLFYTGSIANDFFNFVYDCGSYSGEKCKKRAIDDYVSSLRNLEKTEIDFFVLSHLHRDHFNGINYLMSKIKIKKFYLPFIGYDNDFKALVLAGAVFLNGLNDDNQDEAYAMFNLMLSLYDEESIEGREVVLVGANPENEKEGYAYTKITFNAKFNDKDYWKFTLFNRRIDNEKLTCLLSKMRALIKEKRTESIVDLIKNHRISDIAEIYGQVFNNQNITSTVLLHEPEQDCLEAYYNESDQHLYGRRMSYRLRYPCGFCRNSNKHTALPTSLLTGDIQVDEELANAIKASLNNQDVGVLQIPHHGSHNNYKKLDSEGIHAEVYVAPYGLGNSYKHPSPETIEDLCVKGRTFYSANQYDFFDYIIE